jgi:HSP20 family protein
MPSVSKLPVKRESATETTEPIRHPIGSLRREIDRLFDEFSGAWSQWPFGRRLFDQRVFEPRLLEPRLWRDGVGEINMPAVDIQESEQDYRISAELPGIDEKDVEVTVTDDSLAIRGEKKQARDEREQGYALSERAWGAFERNFSLPSGIDTSRISAEFARGVLTVTLPKTPEAQQKQPRRITVKAG